MPGARIQLVFQSLKILWQPFCMPLSHPSPRRNIQRRRVFLRFLGFNGVFKDDAVEFLKKAREDPEWVEDMLMRFISSQIERLNRGEIAAATKLYVDLAYTHLSLFILCRIRRMSM